MQGIKLIGFLATRFPVIHNTPFESECMHQFALHLEPNVRTTFVDWIKEFETDMHHKSADVSNRYREEGNRLFRSNKKANALIASRCYTDAILAAPDGSKSLALAHANRSAALSEFGYHKEAYEDCQCAVEYGYPEENLQKIMIRQAFCANKLRDYDKLNSCLEKLRTMKLTPTFAKQKEEFEKNLPELKGQPVVGEKPEPKANNMTQNIITNKKKGRYMTASKDIAKGEDIFVEKLFSLVPAGDAKICSGCAAQNFIPFPCNICAKVFYCSLKCKRSQEMVHRFECYAYRSDFMSVIGTPLALVLNTLLNGLPSIIPELKDCTSPMGIWFKIEAMTKSGGKGYSEVLSMATNIISMEPTELRLFSLTASVITYYLMEFTSFFNLFEGCACGIFEWGIVVSALILRHTSQILVNSYSTSTIRLNDSYFHSLSDIWAKPHHVKHGQLHKFSRVDIYYAGIFPYRSICNHSCIPSLASKFDGDRFIALAYRPIRKDSEIFNVYCKDYKLNPRSQRQKELKKFYNFDCKCESCSSDDVDKEFLTFHKFRCQSSKCEAIFTPFGDNLRFWLADEDKMPYLTCPKCNAKLSLEWYWDFERVSKDSKQIKKVLQIFNLSKRFMVGLNELRLHMASTTAYRFFKAWNQRVLLSSEEFKQIGQVVSYLMEQNDGEFDLTYTAYATFALDLMATGKYFDFDCVKIRDAFCMLPAEMKIVFDNYIDDYIGEKFITAE